MLFEEADGSFSRCEGGVVGDAPQQRQVGGRPRTVVVKRSAEPPDRHVTVRREDYQLREHGVVVERDLVAGLDPGVVADAWSFGRSEGEALPPAGTPSSSA